MKDKIIKIILLLLSLICIYCFVYYHNVFLIKQESIYNQLTSTQPCKCYFTRGGFFYCNDSSIKFIDNDNNERWNRSINISSYVIVQEENYLSIGDLKQNIVYVIDSNNKLYPISISHDEKLILFNINCHGLCCVVTKINKSYNIYIYNSEGNIILKCKSNICPIAIDISLHAEFLAMSCIDINNDQMSTQIIFMKPDNKNNLHTFAVVNNDDNFIYKLKFVNDNKIICVGSKKINLLTRHGTEFNKSFSIDLHALSSNEIKILCVSNSMFAVCYDKFHVQLYNIHNGNKVGTFDSPEAIDCIKLKDNSFIVCTRNNLYDISKVTDVTYQHLFSFLDNMYKYVKSYIKELYK
jgi:hypothetical protein